MGICSYIFDSFLILCLKQILCRSQGDKKVKEMLALNTTEETVDMWCKEQRKLSRTFRRGR